MRRRPAADSDPAGRRSHRRRPKRADGTALIGSLAGFTVVIVLLLLAVQVTFDLYARSALTAAAFDAARHVAGYDIATLPADDLARAEATAEARARAALGRYGAAVEFVWSVDEDDVGLRVRVVNPSLLPAALLRPLGMDIIDRTVRVHAERLVCQTACGAVPGSPPGASG